MLAPLITEHLTDLSESGTLFYGFDDWPHDVGGVVACRGAYRFDRLVRGLAITTGAQILDPVDLSLLGAVLDLQGGDVVGIAGVGILVHAHYAALAGFVVAEAIIFVPLLFIAQYYADGGVIESAAMVTLVGFGALTGIAFWTRKDFSFLGGLLKWAMVVAAVAIVGAVAFGFELGTWFSLAMVAVAGAAILYDTSNILHRYPEDRYVAAALQLFASVALMFWYVLRLFISRD